MCLFVFEGSFSRVSSTGRQEESDMCLGFPVLTGPFRRLARAMADA